LSANSPLHSSRANKRGLSPWKEYLGGRASLLNFANTRVPSATSIRPLVTNSRIVGGSFAGISGRGWGPPPPPSPGAVPPPPTSGPPLAFERIRDRNSDILRLRSALDLRALSSCLLRSSATRPSSFCK